MRTPSRASRAVTGLAFESEPDTVKPRLSRTSAMPLIPMPPMPTKCILRILPSIQDRSLRGLRGASCKYLDQVGDPSRRVGHGQVSCGPFHADQPLGHSDQLVQLPQQLLGSEACLLDNAGRTGAFQCARVLELMLIRCARKRNQ